MRRKFPETTLYHVLAAYGDVLNRASARSNGEEGLFPLKLPPLTIGEANARHG